MTRIATTASLLCLLAAVALGSGCGAKGGKKGKANAPFNCKNLAARNAKCADDLAVAMADKIKMTPEQKTKFTTEIKKIFVGDKFVESCTKRMKSKSEKNEKTKAKLKACFGKSGCKAYSECFTQALK